MRNFRQFVRQHQNLVVLTVSGFLVPLITNLISSWLETIYGKTPAQLIQLLAILVALAISLWVLVLLFRKTSRSGVLVPKELRPAPHPGLIVLVGPGRAEPSTGSRPNVAEEAIQYHLNNGNLRRVWLVTSNAGTVAAEKLRDKFGDMVKIMPIHNILDINDTYQVVRQIYSHEANELGMDPSQIIADYSGGTKPMSVGMALAAVSGKHPMQFTSGTEDTFSIPIQTGLTVVDEPTGEA